MGISDIDLVRECLEGNNTAFDTLVSRHQKGVYGLCYRMLGNADDAVDATQSSFLKAYRAMDSFRPDSRLSSWLFGIASNTCIDHIRKKKRQRLESLEELEGSCGEQAHPGPSPEAIVMKEETDRIVLEALGHLPERRRAVMVLFHFNGMGIREISKTLNTPEGTVKSDLHCARETLRKRLEGVIDR